MKKIVSILAALSMAAALFVGCSDPSKTPDSQPAGTDDNGNTPVEKTEKVVLTEKYEAWSQLKFAEEYAKLSETEKATAKLVLDITGASGVQANYGYGCAFIWHSWTDGDASQPDTLKIVAPSDATSSTTAFSVEWTAEAVLNEYDPSSDVGLGLNVWGALSTASIKVTLVYTAD